VLLESGPTVITKDPLGLTEFPYRYHRLAEHCYGFIDEHGMANVGAVDCREGVVLIDSSLHPYYSGRITGFLRSQLRKPVAFLINTHFHRDHTGGNSSVSATNGIISHQRTREFLTQHGDMHYKDGEGIFADLPVVLPQITFGEKCLTLDVTPVVHVINVGGHTHDSCVVHVPAEGVVFAGDAMFAKCAPYLSFWSCLDGFGSIHTWLNSLSEIRTLDPKVVVPGHGPTSTLTDVAELFSFFEHYASQVAVYAASGLDLSLTWRAFLRSRDFIRSDIDGETYTYLVIALYQELKRAAIAEAI
jgi:cyclase